MALVASYHEARLADLLERVRDGFERYDSGELDAFELDELIHRYRKAARELWKFCAEMTGGRNASFIARTLEETQAPSLSAGLTRGDTIRTHSPDHARSWLLIVFAAEQADLLGICALG
jgi:hypothetical protein